MLQPENSVLLREQLSEADLREAWPVLSANDRAVSLMIVARPVAEDIFSGLSSHDQSEVLLALPAAERRSWMRSLPPDDAVDVIQEAPGDRREELLGLLDNGSRAEVKSLMAYREDVAGGLMNPRYTRMRADMTVDEAVTYLRRQAREHPETLSYVYVLDDQQRLKGVATFGQLFAAPPGTLVRDLMSTNVLSVTEQTDQEALSKIFAQEDVASIPVVDSEGHMKGIVTIDDIVDVVQEEATEDIQKLGGMEALDAPYFKTALGLMIRKRAGWLIALFLGEMLTATAMAFFEGAISRAVVLALFIPLIISSGGNSGSQATTLIIRSMALGEIRLRDWWRVAQRELVTGLALGTVLGAIGFLRILAWQPFTHLYGEHYVLVAATIFFSLIGVVTWGTMIGSLLPFVLRRLGFDPASASAPFVATLVDVFGIIIYFSVAAMILMGSLA
ncbi:MAG TPA: magnesium transporter [bacterium]